MSAKLLMELAALGAALQGGGNKAVVVPIIDSKIRALAESNLARETPPSLSAQEARGLFCALESATVALSDFPSSQTNALFDFMRRALSSDVVNAVAEKIQIDRASRNYVALVGLGLPSPIPKSEVLPTLVAGDLALALATWDGVAPETYQSIMSLNLSSEDLAQVYAARPQAFDSATSKQVLQALESAPAEAVSCLAQSRALPSAERLRLLERFGALCGTEELITALESSPHPEELEDAANKLMALVRLIPDAERRAGAIARWRMNPNHIALFIEQASSSEVTALVAHDANLVPPAQRAAVFDKLISDKSIVEAIANWDEVDLDAKIASIGRLVEPGSVADAILALRGDLTRQQARAVASYLTRLNAEQIKALEVIRPSILRDAAPFLHEFDFAPDAASRLIRFVPAPYRNDFARKHLPLADPESTVRMLRESNLPLAERIGYFSKLEGQDLFRAVRHVADGLTPEQKRGFVARMLKAGRSEMNAFTDRDVDAFIRHASRFAEAFDAPLSHAARSLLERQKGEVLLSLKGVERAYAAALWDNLTFEQRLRAWQTADISESLRVDLARTWSGVGREQVQRITLSHLSSPSETARAIVLFDAVDPDYRADVMLAKGGAVALNVALALEDYLDNPSLKSNQATYAQIERLYKQALSATAHSPYAVDLVERSNKVHPDLWAKIALESPLIYLDGLARKVPWDKVSADRLNSAPAISAAYLSAHGYINPNVVAKDVPARQIPEMYEAIKLGESAGAPPPALSSAPKTPFASMLSALYAVRQTVRAVLSVWQSASGLQPKIALPPVRANHQGQGYGK